MKNKILKTCFVGCIATCLTLTGIFAFAPHGASAHASSNNSNLTANAQNNETTTESCGLITPRADDPVLFTTESGLEIKYGNATIQNNLAGGSLNGFPYFTTNDGTNDYDWVIIGQSSLSKQYYLGGVPYAISTWKTTTGLVHKEFYNDNILDASVAGAAISADSNFLVANVMDSVRYSDELPENAVLVMSNTILGTSAFATLSRYQYSNKWSAYQYNISGWTYMTAMQSYYTNGSFGLTSIKSFIQNVSLTTYYSEFYSTGDYGTKSTNASSYLFPLGCTSSSTFYWADYLPSSTLSATNFSGVDTTYWLRGGSGYVWPTAGMCVAISCVNTEGVIASSDPTASRGLRPCFVMSLI